MSDGESYIARRLYERSEAMVLSALNARGRGRTPMIARFALCWKRTETSSRRTRLVRRRQLARKTPESRGKQHGRKLRPAAVGRAGENLQGPKSEADH